MVSTVSIVDVLLGAAPAAVGVGPGGRVAPARGARAPAAAVGGWRPPAAGPVAQGAGLSWQRGATSEAEAGTGQPPASASGRGRDWFTGGKT